MLPINHQQVWKIANLYYENMNLNLKRSKKLKNLKNNNVKRNRKVYIQTKWLKEKSIDDYHSDLQLKFQYKLYNRKLHHTGTCYRCIPLNQCRFMNQTRTILLPLHAYGDGTPHMNSNEIMQGSYDFIPLNIIKNQFTIDCNIDNNIEEKEYYKLDLQLITIFKF